MRSSPRLAPASVHLLVLAVALAACGDGRPAESPAASRTRSSLPRSGQQSRGAVSGQAVELPENLEDLPPGTRSFDAKKDATTTSEELGQRYAGSRVLAVQRGSGSYYSDAFTGRPTASGARYEPGGFTAAHRNLPFGSVLRVTRVDGGQTVYVQVTDRGPYGPRGRILDLSRAAAERLDMLRAGVVKIKVEVLELGARKARRRRKH